MGILNTTPDSFSDGGLHMGLAAALAHAEVLVGEGASIIDVGGESSRPGSRAVSEDEELTRTVPVIEALCSDAGPVRAGPEGAFEVSVDTVKPAVARAGVEAGATMVNDVSGALGELAGELGAAWVAMHRQGPSETMQDAPAYDDVVTEVLTSVVALAEAALSAGAPRVWIDPGIGFGKTLEHNVALLGALDRFVGSGHPVLLGASRKAMFGSLGAESDRRVGIEVGGDRVPVDDRLDGSIAVATWAGHLGVDVIRAHDVAATVSALRIVSTPLDVLN